MANPTAAPVTNRYKTLTFAQQTAAFARLTMHPMTKAPTAEGRCKMNNENQTIRHQFLALACQYLFGQDARCENFRHIGLGTMNLQPIPISNCARSH
jgi:hypothetical protein